MKIKASEDLTEEDISAVSLGLYHTVKSRAAVDVEPANAVEFSLRENAHEAFSTYTSSLYKSILSILENKQ